MFCPHVSPSTFWQWPDPSHLSGALQVSSVPPPATLVQVPPPHATQVVSQAVSQQTPSTGQKPLTHWPADAQACPFTVLQAPLPSQALAPAQTGLMSVPLIG